MLVLHVQRALWLAWRRLTDLSVVCSRLKVVCFNPYCRLPGFQTQSQLPHLAAGDRHTKPTPERNDVKPALNAILSAVIPREMQYGRFSDCLKMPPHA